MILQRVTIDETHFIDDCFRPRLNGSKVRTVYLFDASVGINACEITPSYELHPVNTYISHEADLTDDEQYDLQSGEVICMQVRAVNKLSPKDVNHDAEDTFEDVLGALRANCGGLDYD